MGNGALNAPNVGVAWFVGEVWAHNDTHVVQSISTFAESGVARAFHRHEAGGVWQPWVEGAGLPARLNEYGTNISDWNTVRQNGWHAGNNAQNGPPGMTGWATGIINAQANGYLEQEIWSFQGPTEQHWRRSILGDVPSAWERVYKTATEVHGRFWPDVVSGDMVTPLNWATQDANARLMEDVVSGCLVWIDRPCKVPWARVQQKDNVIPGALTEVVLYKASTMALVGSFGTYGLDSKGVKTITASTPLVIAEPGYYIPAMRVRTVGVNGPGANIQGYFEAAGVGHTLRDLDFYYGADASLAWSVPGVTAAPASLVGAPRVNLGQGRAAPIIVLGVTP
jgi:hypothetical protein